MGTKEPSADLCIKRKSRETQHEKCNINKTKCKLRTRKGYFWRWRDSNFFHNFIVLNKRKC